MSNPKIKKLKYAFKEGARYGIDANDAGSELARIHSAHGVLEPAAVVKESEPETAPLHPVFEWDDHKAAGQYRNWQARVLIKSVRVIPNENEAPEPVYVHVGNSANTPAAGYQPVSVVVNRPDMFASALSELTQRVTAAQEAVERLQKAAKGNPESDQDRMARIALAVQAMQTAREAISALH